MAVADVPHCHQHWVFSVNEAGLGMPYFAAPTLQMSYGNDGCCPHFSVVIFWFLKDCRPCLKFDYLVLDPGNIKLT